MAKAFASRGDMTAKTISFIEIGAGLYAFTAEGDPNTGVVIGDDGVMVVDAQATPVMARQVIEKIRTRHRQADQICRAVALSRGARARRHRLRRRGDHASEICRAMIPSAARRTGTSEFQRFPRLFQAAEIIPGLTWPTLTFASRDDASISASGGSISLLGRAHTAGDIVALRPGRRRHVDRRHRRIQIRLLLRRRAFQRLAGDARGHPPASRRTPSRRAGATR